MKICVLGGGPAGVEAAAEAARSGSEVTLVERSSSLLPARAHWSSFLDKGGPPDIREHMLRALGVHVIHGVAVKSLGRRGLVYGSGSGARFDRVVIATGSSPLPVVFQGSKKSGVHILGRQADYFDFAACQRSISRCVISGSGTTPFEVAEKLCRRGAKVTILGRGHTPGGLCRALGELLEVRAFESGVKVTGLRLQKAFGAGPLEAVVAGGKVIPCDTIAVLPPLSADYPPGSPGPGPHGGIVVNEQMCTTEPEVYAAGSCAEMATPEARSTLSLGMSGTASGRVAGAASSGRDATLKVAGTFSALVFGVWMEGAGLTSEMAIRAGLKVVETVKLAGASTACSLVHQGSTGRLVGGQVAGSEARGMSGLIASAVSQRLDVKALAFADLWDSTDISLLQDTARQALAW